MTTNAMVRTASITEMATSTRRAVRETGQWCVHLGDDPDHNGDHEHPEPPRQVTVEQRVEEPQARYEHQGTQGHVDGGHRLLPERA